MIAKLVAAGLGLAVTLVFLAPALATQARGKAPRFVGATLFLAGVGLTGLAWLLITLVTSAPWRTGIGVFALAGLLGSGFAIFWDVKDGKLDRTGQWLLFVVPSMLAVVLFTGPDAVPWLADQAGAAFAQFAAQADRS
ncbi:hypothetical protein [Nonomuraea sp. CA-141351]|uniref:hypothetical protein n=1 Tax=Nonomuraea sp. CA-141351 TaxID=3239996 RepID=UPI003D90BFEE